MWLALLFLILLVPVYLLFAKLVIEIDSTKDFYCARLGKIIKVSLIWIEGKVKIKLRIFGITKIVDITKPQQQKKKKTSTKKQKISLQKIIRILKTFKVTKCHILIDTDNMPLNGILYPVFYLLSRYTGKTILINFYGENTVQLKIENTLARMLWAYIKP